MKLHEQRLINTYDSNPHKACREFVDSCITFDIEAGKLLIKQYIYELTGEEIELQSDLNLEKYEQAKKIAYLYFKSEK